MRGSIAAPWRVGTHSRPARTAIPPPSSSRLDTARRIAAKQRRTAAKTRSAYTKLLRRRLRNARRRLALGSEDKVVHRRRELARRAWGARFRLTYRRTVARVPIRAELPHVLNRRGLVGRAVEIGVHRGKFSDQLLRAWRGRELISVDTWPDLGVYEIARERLSRHGDRSQMWRMTSEEASRHVAPGELDFVYIDAAHDYDSVKLDLECWYDKVRPGGIVAGHDYSDEGTFGVKSAVDEFFAAKGVPVHATGAEPIKGGRKDHKRRSASWMVEVPRDR